MRLVNGSISSIGRVEICSYDANGGLVWGTLCHRHWNNTDTRIVCHELGYTELGKLNTTLQELSMQNSLGIHNLFGINVCTPL